MEQPRVDFPDFDVLGLEDVREAISGVEEFKESKHGDIIFFNYRWCNQATFPCLSQAKNERERQLFLLRRECRGLAFTSDGKIVARRFHKFFNVGERDDTKVSSNVLVALFSP